MKLLAAVAALLTLATAAYSATVQGRVLSQGSPLVGVRVEAHASLDISGRPLALSEPTDSEGLYRLELPAGSYALMARDPQNALFAFCGKNPVQVQQENLWAGLLAVPAEPARISPYEDAYTSAIEGQVLYEGRPVEGAFVYLYLDTADHLRGPGYRQSLPTDAGGYFSFDGLPESSYYVTARKRQEGGKFGPALEGDLLGYFPSNPLTTRAGEKIRLQLGLIQKARSEEASGGSAAASDILVSGVILGPEGTPLAGLHVFAYTDREVGHRRPDALSPPTGPDGRFRLSLPAAGTYYLGARQNYGDSPAPGELFGMYERTTNHDLTVKNGQTLSDIRIMVEPIDL